MKTMVLRDDEMIAHRNGTARRALVRPPEHEHEKRHDRAVDEYDGEPPTVITVYSPLPKRYFRGGGRYEDRILA
jgi:hypothetical protein